MRRRKLLRRTAGGLGLLFALLFVVYAWLAWRPTGFDGGAEAIARGEAVIAKREQALAAAAPAEDPPPGVLRPAQGMAVGEPRMGAKIDQQLTTQTYLALRAIESHLNPGASGGQAIVLTTETIRQLVPPDWPIYASSGPPAAAVRRQARGAMISAIPGGLLQESQGWPPPPEVVRSVGRVLDLAERRPGDRGGWITAEMLVERALAQGDPARARWLLRENFRTACRDWLAQQRRVALDQNLARIASRGGGISLADLAALWATSGEGDDALLEEMDRMAAAVEPPPDAVSTWRAADAAESVRRIEKYLDNLQFKAIQDSTLNWMLNQKLEPFVRKAALPAIRTNIEIWGAAVADGDWDKADALASTIRGEMQWLGLGGYERKEVQSALEHGRMSTVSTPPVTPNLQRIYRAIDKATTDQPGPNPAIEVTRMTIAAARYRLARGAWPDSLESLRAEGLIDWLAPERAADWSVVRAEAFHGPVQMTWSPAFNDQLTSPTSRDLMYGRALYEYQQAHGWSGPEAAADLAPYLPAGAAPGDFASYFRDWPATTMLVRTRSIPLAEIYALSAHADSDLSTSVTQVLLNAPPATLADYAVLCDPPRNPTLEAVLREARGSAPTDGPAQPGEPTHPNGQEH